MCFTFLIEIIFSEIFIRAISVTGFYLIEIFERLEINSSLFKISFHHLYFIHCEHLWLQNAENYFLSLTRTILSLLNSVGGQARCIDLHINTCMLIFVQSQKYFDTLPFKSLLKYLYQQHLFSFEIKYFNKERNIQPECSDWVGLEINA